MTKGMKKYERMDRFELEAHAHAYELKYKDMIDNMEERFSQFREEEITKSVAHERQAIDAILNTAMVQNAELMVAAKAYTSRKKDITIGESIIIERFVKFVIEGKIDWDSTENYNQQRREHYDELRRHFKWLDGGK